MTKAEFSSEAPNEIPTNLPIYDLTDSAKL